MSFKKFLESYEVLNEIGDSAVLPPNLEISWDVGKQGEKVVYYEFVIGDVQYLVSIQVDTLNAFKKDAPIVEKGIKVDFSSRPHNDKNTDLSGYKADMTGEGIPLKILSAVSAIAIKFIKEDYKKMFGDSKPHILKKILIGAKKEEKEDMRRHELYKRFTKKAFEREGIEVKNVRELNIKQRGYHVSLLNYEIEPYELTD